MIQESSRGVNALYEAEVKVAELEDKYERELNSGFLNASGSIPERTAYSRLQAADSKLAYELARAEL